jgi:hypothetical protein
MVRARLQRLASYLLGAFVCAELIYIPLTNILQRIPRQVPLLPVEILGRLQVEGRATNSDTGQAVIDATGTACDRWGEATAQGQNWSLFAPRFGEAGTFLTLEVMTADGPVELRSRFEPGDPNHYVRFNLVDYRIFYREMSYAFAYTNWTSESYAERREEWREAIHDHVAAFRHTLPAYVRLRLERELPGVSVREVIVAVRVFLPPKPSGPRPAPVKLALAKWVPERPGEVLAFDVVSEKFVSVER